jgi:tetratricopeptide (TPR) repeat protein
LYQFDYRIRKRVRHALEQRRCIPTNAGHEVEQQNIAFQLALCYKIGFGGAIDEQLSKDRLCQSVRSMEDLIGTLEKTKSALANNEANPGQIYAALVTLGDVQLLDLAAQYHKLGILHDAEAETRRELADIKRSLGTHNALWIWTATLLSGLYSQRGRWKQAEELYLETIDVLATIFDSKHPSTLTAMANAAACFSAQQEWRKAEKFEAWILETRKALLLQERIERAVDIRNGDSYINEGDDATNEAWIAPTLNSESQCAISRLSEQIENCLEQRQFEDVDALQLEILETLQRILGEDDITPLRMMRSLIESYLNRKQWDDVERLQVKELEIHRNKFGGEHSRTLASFSNLTLTYWHQGKQQAARTLQENILETCVRVLEPEHRVTMTVISNLMTTYKKLGQDSKSAEMRERLVQYVKKDLSQNLTNRKIVNSMANLARTYRGQGRWAEAEGLQVQVLEERIRTLGPEHPETQQSAAEMKLIEEGKKKLDTICD